ncbi:hypothetical protein IAE22_29955, partial [Bacillus sp. S34]|nr:hypothetical protein [Bacillus sp. S34]
TVALASGAERFGVRDTAFGAEDSERLVRSVEADVVLNGITGSVGLGPTLAALESGATLVLPGAPELSVTKDGALADGAAGSVGDTVDLTFTVTNTGDVPSKSIAKDSTWTGSLTLNKDVKLGIELDEGVGVRQRVRRPDDPVDEFADEDWIRFFDPSDPVEGIRRSIVEAASAPSPTTSADFSRRLSP